MKYLCDMGNVCYSNAGYVCNMYYIITQKGKDALLYNSRVVSYDQ